MTAPLPVPKGLFAEISTGKRVRVSFLKHNADAGETEGDDCFITISEKLNCGTAGQENPAYIPWLILKINSVF